MNRYESPKLFKSLLVGMRQSASKLFNAGLLLTVSSLFKSPLPGAVMATALLLLMPILVANAAENDHNEGDNPLTARKVFEKIEIPALDILPVSTRLDMLDYWDADSIYKASNIMEGLSWLECLEPSYLKLRLTPVSMLEIKILPAKKDPIVLALYTVGSDTQASDTQVDFYDSNLAHLETKKHFDTPQLKDYFDLPKGSLTSMKEISQMIPFPTVSYSASADGNDLSSKLTVKDYISEDDWNIIKLFLKPNITLKWEKEKYKYK